MLTIKASFHTAAFSARAPNNRELFFLQLDLVSVKISLVKSSCCCCSSLIILKTSSTRENSFLAIVNNNVNEFKYTNLIGYLDLESACYVHKSRINPTFRLKLKSNVNLWVSANLLKVRMHFRKTLEHFAPERKMQLFGKWKLALNQLFI